MSTRRAQVAGLLLAAGAGRRFGRPKALVGYRGEPLVSRGVTLLRAGGCDPVHVVLGAAAHVVIATVDLGEATVVVNSAWPEGMGSSLRCGLDSLPATAEAVVVALVDQPGVGAGAVRRLRAAHDAGVTVAVATYAGRRRNPVLLARETWAEVAAFAQGDVGARPFLRAHPELVTPVACDDTGTPHDVDTPADLR